MGQTLRRATGRVRPSRPDPPVKKVDQPPTFSPPAPAVPTDGQDRLGISDSEISARVKDDSEVLEQRDPSYDEMLKHLVGRVRSRPGGKQEMGKAFIAERYDRPLPKIRSSKAETGSSGPKSLPPGTLNAEQVRQIVLLHQGKSDEHCGPMEIEDIAKKFGANAADIQMIVQFVSLLPEDSNKKANQ